MLTNTITDVTRRDIRRALSREGVLWNGELDEVEFLNRLYDLGSLPSYDGRYETAEDDIWQHRIRNNDWDDNWVLSDERFHLGDGGPDAVFLRFLAEMVHPIVRSDREQAQQIVAMLNDLLVPDGWHLVETNSISGRPIYEARRLHVGLPSLESLRSTVSDFDADYFHRQINRMESAMPGDPELAIGTAKELVETCCRTILAERGKPVDDKPELPKLVRRTLEDLKLVPEGFPDGLNGAKSIRSLLGSLATITQTLAELRNLYGTGHGKHAMTKALSSRHAQLAVEASASLVRFLFATHMDKPMVKDRTR